MKKLIALFVVVFLLCGCQSTDGDMNEVLKLRQKVTASEKVTFDGIITADYGDMLHSFGVSCKMENAQLHFTVTSPESIAGITGYFDGQGGKLTFSDQVLAFPLLAEGQLSPVSAPWLFLQTLRGGYLVSSGEDGDLIRICIDESYEENVLRADIWTDLEYNPVRCDFLWSGRRILSMEIENFSCL